MVFGMTKGNSWESTAEIVEFSFRRTYRSVQILSVTFSVVARVANHLKRVRRSKHSVFKNFQVFKVIPQPIDRLPVAGLIKFCR